METFQTAIVTGNTDSHLTIGLDAVLEAVQLPAGITNLDTGLADVDGDDFTHVEWVWLLSKATKMGTVLTAGIG